VDQEQAEDRLAKIGGVSMFGLMSVILGAMAISTASAGEIVSAGRLAKFVGTVAGNTVGQVEMNVQEHANTTHNVPQALVFNVFNSAINAGQIVDEEAQKPEAIHPCNGVTSSLEHIGN
jgi:hypothetical protein